MFPLDLDRKHLTLTGRGWSLSRKRPDSFQDFIPGLNNTLADLGPWQPIRRTNCNLYKIMTRNKTPDFAAHCLGKFTVFAYFDIKIAIVSFLTPPSSVFPVIRQSVRAGLGLNNICEQSKRK